MILNTRSQSMHTRRHNDCLNIYHCSLIGEWTTAKCIHFIFTPALIHQKYIVAWIIRRSIYQYVDQSKVSNNGQIDWGAWVIVFVYLKYHSRDCWIPQIPQGCSQGEQQRLEWLEVIGFHDDPSHILNADVKYYRLQQNIRTRPIMSTLTASTNKSNTIRTCWMIIMRLCRK